MNQATEECGIVFADIAGSTRLFDKLGDTTAKSIVSHCLDTMTMVTERHGGRVIKTIGDEVMCAFPSPDSSMQACMDMQETVSADTSAGLPLMIRVGVHYGPVIVQEDGDVFGDTVIVAKRLSDIAKANQILTAEDTLTQLSPVIARDAREFDRTMVKGKQGLVTIYEMIWQHEDMTCMATGSFSAGPPAEASSSLQLKWARGEVNMGLSDMALSFGRGAQADKQAGGRLASRIHFHIEPRRGKFVVIDKSTNGTYVRPDIGKPFFLRREEAPLTGSGVIGIGCAPENATPDDVIRYQIG